jgi:Protein of unknown function (DUF2442)
MMNAAELLTEDAEINTKIIERHVAEQGILPDSEHTLEDIIRFALRFTARRLNAEVPLLPRDKDRPVAVDVKDNLLLVTLQDGRVIATPLDWYPRLKNATSEQIKQVEFISTGIHWPDLDEDLSVRGMLMGDL